MTDPSARRVLITGIAGELAGRLAARLETDDRVAALAGIDMREPAHRLTRTEFVRGDLRHRTVTTVIESLQIDTLVHLALSSVPGLSGGRAATKERNVVGAMQLLAAAHKAAGLRTVVTRSTTAVYGSGPSDPALFREDAEPQVSPPSGYARDAVEVEAYMRGFGRRRPDVSLVILRFANLVGPTVVTPLTRYISLPVVPTVLGYDPRIQLCHEDDAVEILARMALEPHPGIYNVAGPGILYLSQAVRLAGKPSIAVPSPLVGPAARIVRRTTGIDFSPDQLAYLLYGRVGDIGRMRRELGYEPRFSTRQAYADFLTTRVPRLVDGARLRRAEAALISALGRDRDPWDTSA